MLTRFPFSIALAIGVVQAQYAGTIGGFVTDPSGAAVAGSTVTATLVSQNAVRTTTTAEDGSYVFNAMPPGVYRVTAEKAGFQQMVQSGITLSTNQNLRLDLPMRLGQV